MDHVGITVPNVADAVAWFEDVLGCSSPLAFGPFSDPTGTFIQDLLDVHPRAVVEHIRGDGRDAALGSAGQPSVTSQANSLATTPDRCNSNLLR